AIETRNRATPQWVAELSREHPPGPGINPRIKRAALRARRRDGVRLEAGLAPGQLLASSWRGPRPALKRYRQGWPGRAWRATWGRGRAYSAARGGSGRPAT